MKKYFNFVIQDKKFAVPLVHVEEVVTPVQYTSLPEERDYILGVFNLRGQIISLVDIKAKMGLGASEFVENRSCFVIFEVKGHKIAIVVDEVEEVLLLEENDITKIGDLKKSKFVTGVVRASDQSIVLVADIERLLDIQVLERISKEAA